MANVINIDELKIPKGFFEDLNTPKLLAWLDSQVAENYIEVPTSGIGDLSDGYHTFNELYHHRAILFSVICNSMPNRAWKSKLHDTGDMFDGMFIVGIETPEGQATYHYDINPYWDMFNVKELDRAPAWDGHSAEDAIERIKSLSTLVMRKSSEWIPCGDGEHTPLMCASCGQSWPFYKKRGSKFCPNCGAEMIKECT